MVRLLGKGLLALIMFALVLSTILLTVIVSLPAVVAEPTDFSIMDGTPIDTSSEGPGSGGESVDPPPGQGG